MAPRLDEFLFDTSALLKYYRDEDGSAAVRFWIDELPRQRGQRAHLFLPNICIPEALSFFYRLCHLQHEVTDDTLKRLVATFLNDLQQGKFAVYNLSRRDIFATEPLYGLAHEEYRRRRHRRQRLLSPMDIMVLAIAYTFKERHPHVSLVTADAQMAGVARRIGVPALNPIDDETIPERLRP